MTETTKTVERPVSGPLVFKRLQELTFEQLESLKKRRSVGRLLVGGLGPIFDEKQVSGLELDLDIVNQQLSDDRLQLFALFYEDNPNEFIGYGLLSYRPGLLGPVAQIEEVAIDDRRDHSQYIVAELEARAERTARDLRLISSAPDRVGYLKQRWSWSQRQPWEGYKVTYFRRLLCK